MPLRRALIALLCLLATASAWPHAARASTTQESIFQDDNMLIYEDPATLGATLDRLRAIGVDRLRVTIKWSAVAPAPLSTTKPAGFDGSDPAAYPSGAWDRYDTLVDQATQRGLALDFNVTAPAPYWATQPSDRDDLRETFSPSAAEFGAFVKAVATRYSGSYVPPAAAAPATAPASDPVLPTLPAARTNLRQAPAAAGAAPIGRVSFWTVWNEPNQPGWLTPQWVADPRNAAKFVETSPEIYRGLVDAAWSALQATGHGRDTILIGETAPKGQNTARGESRAIKPARFIRQLYCLDDHLQFLRGSDAQVRGCPVSDQARTMTQQHPALFQASGYAHHPYELTFSPSRPPTSSDDLTVGNLPVLSRLLRRIYQRYGQKPPGGGHDVPLWLTEFGYQTRPPDPTGVTLAQQAAYLDQAEYVTERDPQVRALSQFLLVDDKPIAGADALARYGATFQTGLLTDAGKEKPSYAAYQLPLWIQHPRVRAGRSVALFGLVRPARNGTAPVVAVQARGRGATAYRTVRTVTGTAARGYVRATVKLARSGAIRLSWTSPSGAVLRSRAVSVTVTRTAHAR